MTKSGKPVAPRQFGWVFIILLCVLFGGFWLLMHRVLPDEVNHKINSSNQIVNNNILLEDRLRSKQHIQSLIEETQKLLREVVASNVSVSKGTIHDLRLVTEGTNSVSKDLSELNKQLTRLEDGYTICMKEKYDLGMALSTCKSESAKRVSVREVAPQPSNQVKAVSCTTNLDAARAESTSDGSAEKWLVIGIPTVARANNEDYLLRSLETLVRQLPDDPADLMFDRIVVNVVNLQINANPAKEHIIYTKAKEKFSHAANHPKARYFSFTEATKDDLSPDPKPGTNSVNDHGNANHPGFLVRRQTRNIVTVMRKNINKAKYYLFLEDDMQFCNNGLLAIQYLLSKASRYHPNWLAIRASYGMNGIFMHQKDLGVFADYLIKHQARRPPDHLVVEWYAGETPEAASYRGKRANIGFRYNLFNHIGVVSTLRSQRSTSYPKCYELLTEPTVFQVEAFNPKQCPKDDIWPCNVKNPDNFRIDWAHQ